MSTEHTGEYCQHKDKMQMDRAEAKSLAGRLQLTSYHCQHCGKWHVAHKKRTLRPGRRRVNNRS